MFGNAGAFLLGTGYILHRFGCQKRTKGATKIRLDKKANERRMKIKIMREIA